MKKILLSLLLAFVCVQVYSAVDLPLSLSDDNVFTGNSSTFDPATGEITLNDNYSQGVGWDFSGLLTLPSKDDYPTVKFVFAEPLAVPFMEIKITYANQDPDKGDFYIGVPTGSTSFIIPLTGDVLRIYFQSSNWHNCTDNPEDCFDNAIRTFTLKSATFVAAFATEKEDLSLTDVTVNSSMSFDPDTKCLTLNSLNWDQGIVWTFDPPLSDEEYVGVGFTFAQPVPDIHNFNLNVHYPGTLEAGEQTVGINIPAGATSVSFNFTRPVDQINILNQDWQGYNDTISSEGSYPHYVYFDEMYLIKKAGAGLKTINVNTGPVDVYTILGVKVRNQVERANALKGLEKGIYIVGRKKVLVTTAP